MTSAPHITLQPAKVDTRSPDHNGFLVFANDALVAVFVRLEDEGHGDLAGIGSWRRALDIAIRRRSVPLFGRPTMLRTGCLDASLVRPETLPSVRVIS